MSDAFEQWAADKNFIVCVRSGTGYINVKEMAREAWQAAQAQAVNQQLLEALWSAIDCLSIHGDGFADLGAMTVLQDFVAAIAAAQEEGK